MQYEIFKTIIFVLLFTFSTYAISKELWMLGLKEKVKSFGKFWGAISFLIGGIASGVGLIVLIKLF